MKVAFAIACLVLLAHATRASGLSGATTAAPPAPTPWQVYQILDRHCSQCHGGHLAKPKGKFGYILDLRRMSEKDYVKAGHPENSKIYKALIAVDPDDRMPPDDSDAPPMSEQDIKTIHDWIAAGAPLDDGRPGIDSSGDAIPAAKPEKPSHPIMQFLGRLHPLLVHFPIALLLCAFLAELARTLLRHLTWLDGMVSGCIRGGALAALAAAVCGWLNAGLEGYTPGSVDTHRWLGVTTAIVAVIVPVMHRFSTRRHAPRQARPVLLLSLFIVAVLVAFAGHTGGIIAYGADYFSGR